MLLFKIWDFSRTRKVFVSVDENVQNNIREFLIQKGSEKLNIVGTHLVLESDGTQIDDDETLRILNGEIIMLLELHQNWHAQDSLSLADTLSVTSSLASLTSLSETKSDSNDSFEGTSSYENPWQAFQIPWERLSSTVISDCQNGNRNPLSSNTVIQTVVDAMREVSTNVSNKIIRVVAHKIVSKYPKMFRDIDDDGVVMADDGSITVFSKLKERLRYLNRQYDNSSLTIPLKMRKKMLSAKAGCSNWQPQSVIADNDGTDRRQELLTVDFRKFDYRTIELLQDTYAEQRTFLNQENPPSVLEIKEKWPILLSPEGIFWHFEKLMNKKVHDLTTNILKKSEKIISVGIKKKYIDICPSIEDDRILTVLRIILKFFGENEDCLYVEIENKNEIASKVSYVTPLVLVLNKDNIKKYCVVVEREELQWCESFQSAFLQMFALYFNLNLEYPDKASNSCEILQRNFLKIYPEQGTKNKKSAKAKMKLVSFFNHFR